MYMSHDTYMRPGNNDEFNNDNNNDRIHISMETYTNR